MSRPRFKIRELMFIGLPTALVIAGAAFLSRQQAVREQNRSGPYRAEITRVEILPVSPFEAWQGFDTKIVVHLSERGQFKSPAGLKSLRGTNVVPYGIFGQKVTLIGRVNGKEKSVPVTSQDYGGSFELEHPGISRALMMGRNVELKNMLTFLAATSGFDPNSPIQLRGKIWGEVGTISRTQIVPLPPHWL